MHQLLPVVQMNRRVERQGKIMPNPSPQLVFEERMGVLPASLPMDSHYNATMGRFGTWLFLVLILLAGAIASSAC